ncbi:4531_t:CDS:2 [Dentiscutata erythropus]|uniref:4531_t:CDS:1 n=1 Tax=Dentiscutata erythropus TaxID=1348616 RepID=A0A9N9A519_9GLOM|nr:4531_t:CDS:2 [Dentiscutata erythropus]
MSNNSLEEFEGLQEMSNNSFEEEFGSMQKMTNNLLEEEEFGELNNIPNDYINY